ncbi:MAG: hypothetical protein ACKVQW_06015 [Pyrinomonadaceae bacterium]
MKILSREKVVTLLKLIGLAIGVGLIIVGLIFIRDYYSPSHYSLSYGIERDETGSFPFGVVPVIGIFVLLLLFFSGIKASQMSSNIWESRSIDIPSVFLVGASILVLISVGVGFYLSFYSYKKVNHANVAESLLSLEVTGPPGEIRANESIEINAVLTLNRNLMEGLVTGDIENEKAMFGLRESERRKKIKKKIDEAIKKGKGFLLPDLRAELSELKYLEYESSTRLQSGFTSNQEWQKNKPVGVSKNASWTWILTPALDRFGQQKILIEGVVYNDDGRILAEARSETIYVNVQTPLGLPWWLGYGLSLVGGISIFAWIWDFAKERWLKRV